MSGGILDHAGPHAVHVRMGLESDRIETVRLMVVPKGDDFEEIDVDRRVLGYIHQAGNVFVALAGERLDRAEECGQSLLWDKAAADLVRRARLDRSPCTQCVAPATGKDAKDPAVLAHGSTAAHRNTQR